MKTISLHDLIVKLQEKKLQANKPLGIITKLPSLDSMDRLLFNKSALAFIPVTGSSISTV